MNSEPKEYKLVWLFKNYLKGNGLRGILLGFDFVLSFLLTVILIVLARFDSNKVKEFVYTISPDLIVICITLLTIILAGLAIIISFTDDDYILFLKKTKLFYTILFEFIFVAYIAGAGIFFLIIMELFKLFYNQYSLLMGFAGFFFTFYALFGSLLLFQTIIRTAILRGEYIEYTKNI